MERFSPFQQITIKEQPQPYAFPGEWFEIALCPLGEGGAVSPKEMLDSDDITLQTSLHLHSGRTPLKETRVASQHELVIEAPLNRILRRLIVGDAYEMRCKIEGEASSDTPMKFSIEFILSSKEFSLSSVFTNTIHLVNYKLWVEPFEWNDVWYADEGDWDKCMKAQVRLLERNGSLGLGRSVIFRVTIHYDDAESTEVLNQKILRVLGGYEQIIRHDTGFVSISYRVDDLSKNHHGNDFKLLMKADETKYHDIGSTFSPSFTVRSKKHRKLGLQPVTSLTDSNDKERTPTSIVVQRNTITSAELDESLLDVPRARSALNSIIGWADQVANELSLIKWKFVGYEASPDGTIDFSKPVHESPNPNEAISKLLSMYSAKVKEELQILRNAAGLTIKEKKFPETLQGVISKSHTEDSTEVWESQVTYLLAENYHTLQAGKALGYPAFNEEKLIIGFFGALSPGMENFTPIHQLSKLFDETEQENVAEILKDAIENRKDTLYCISNYDTLQSLLSSAYSEFECKIKPLLSKNSP